MKINRILQSKKFQKNIKLILAKYYSDAIKETIRRSFKNKRKKLRNKRKFDL